MTENPGTPPSGTSEGAQPFDPRSVLGRLAQRRQEVAEDQVLTIPVPRWSDPTVKVRYGLLDSDTLDKGRQALEKAQKNKGKGNRVAEANLNANIDILVAACQAVFAELDELPEETFSMRIDDENGQPTLFDPDLAAALALHDGATARQVVKALFISDGDIMAHASEVVEWSGYKRAEMAEAGLGG